MVADDLELDSDDDEAVLAVKEIFDGECIMVVDNDDGFGDGDIDNGVRNKRNNLDVIVLDIIIIPINVINVIIVSTSVVILGGRMK